MLSLTNRLSMSALLSLLVVAPAHAFITWGGHSDGTIHQYQIVVADGISWNDANVDTSTLGTGWHLATVTSTEEQSHLLSALFAGVSGKFWLGAWQDSNAVDAYSGWNWVTGEAWGYTNWDAIHMGEDNGDYLMTTNRLAWGWDDYGNSGRITGYIAERSGDSVYVSEPTTLALMGLAMIGLAATRRRKQQ